jgi:plasmid maintenance system antidote protein VapI
MPGQLRAVRSGLGGDGVKLEWRTGCGVVTPFDSEEYDHLYEVGDAEDCVECDSPVERPCQATVCEVSPMTPARILRDALEERGWTQKDLAHVLRRPTQVVNEIAQGKKRITATTAFELEAALGIWAKDWLEADMAYEMRKAAKKATGGIVRRAIVLSKRKAKK